MRKRVDVLTLTATPIPRTLEHVACRHPRHVHHRDAAQGSPVDPDQRAQVRSGGDPACDTHGARARRPGVLRAQPGRVDLLDGQPRYQAGARGACRGRPRPDERGRARARDGRLRRAQIRRAARDDDHRERPRHPEREHDHHQSLRSLRPLAALPAARPGRAVRPARLRVPADSAGGFAVAGGEEAAGRDPRVQRSRAAASASPRSISRSAAPATCSAASRAGTSRRSASTCT